MCLYMCRLKITAIYTSTNLQWCMFEQATYQIISYTYTYVIIIHFLIVATKFGHIDGDVIITTYVCMLIEIDM